MSRMSKYARKQKKKQATIIRKQQKLEKETQKKWKEFTRWEHINKNRIREGQYISDYDEFKELLNDGYISGNIDKIKEEQLYQTSKKTFKAWKKAYSFYMDEPLDEKKISRAMSTQELAEILKSDIEQYKTDLINSGKTKKEARLAVSQFFFGS